MTPERRCYQLLTVLQSHAPTGTEQALCTSIYNRMGADGLSYADQERQLVSALSDGLNHGNWPWVIRPDNTYLGATVANLAAEQAVNQV